MLSSTDADFRDTELRNSLDIRGFDQFANTRHAIQGVQNYGLRTENLGIQGVSQRQKPHQSN
jgi:hypothetical protein